MPSYRVVYYPLPQAETAHRTAGGLALAPTAAPPARLQNVSRRSDLRRGPSEDDVEQQLLLEGYQLISITPIERIARWNTKFREEKITLYRRLSRVAKKSNRVNLEKDFLPMFPATGKFHDHARDFLRAIENGPIYRAMAGKPAVFADYEVNLLEIAANTAEAESTMLDMLADSLKLENRISRWAKQLLVYPTILLVFICIAVGAYYGVMLPKLLANVQPNAADFPIYMRLIMLPYEIFSNPITGVLTGGALAAIAIGAVFAYAVSPALQTAAEYAVLMFTGPYGKILITSLQLRILSVLRLLLTRGDQDRAYEILQGAAIGRVARKALKAVQQAREEGQASWAHAMYAGKPVLTTEVVSRIVNAESTGANLEMVTELGVLIEEKEQDGDILFEDLKTKLNTSMILAFAAVIGMMYVSLYLPVQYFLTHAH